MRSSPCSGAARGQAARPPADTAGAREARSGLSDGQGRGRPTGIPEARGAGPIGPATAREGSGRLVVLTNGNFFARLILGPLIEERHEQIAGVIIVTGVMAGKSRRQSLLEVLRRSGWRHFFYKANTYLIFALAGLLMPWRTFFVHQLARRHGIPFHLANQINDARVVERVAAWKPDVLVSVSCPQRVGPALLALPTRAAINIHSSLLPRYAGISPYFWVLANGERRTGTTVHLMRERFDSGDIILQRALEVRPRESVFSLFMRLSILGGEALAEAVTELCTGRASPAPQALGERSYFSWPTPEGSAELYRRGHRFARARDFARALMTRL